MGKKLVEIYHNFFINVGKKIGVEVDGWSRNTINATVKIAKIQNVSFSL